MNLLEYAQYVENYYGTPKAYVQEQLNAQKHVILEIEIQGALKIKEQFPQTLLLFVTPPSARDFKRSSDRTWNRDRRMLSIPVCHELWKKLMAVKYTIIWLINDELDAAVENVHRDYPQRASAYAA